MPADDLTVQVTTYIQENLCPETSTEEITETTPLFERGLLDSLRTAMLLNFIRTELGVVVPELAIEFTNFRDPRSIAAMVRSLRASQTETGVGA